MMTVNTDTNTLVGITPSTPNRSTQRRDARTLGVISRWVEDGYMTPADARAIYLASMP